MTLLLQPMFTQKQRRNRSHAIPEPKGKRTPLCEGGVKFGSSHGDTLEQGGVPARLNLAHSPKPVCDEYHNCGKIFAVRVQCRALSSSLVTSRASSTRCASNAPSAPAKAAIASASSSRNTDARQT